MRTRTASLAIWYLSITVVCSTIVGCPDTGKVSVRAKSDKNSDDWNSHTQGLPFVFGYEEGMAKAKSEGKPAMLFVTTTWCGWCKKLANESFRDPEIRDLLIKNFVCVLVDGDTEVSAKQKLGVRGYPHVVFVSANGVRLQECIGYVPSEKFLSLVRSALERNALGQDKSS
jgi:thioredoxin-related protein